MPANLTVEMGVMIVLMWAMVSFVVISITFFRYCRDTEIATCAVDVRAVLAFGMIVAEIGVSTFAFGPMRPANQAGYFNKEHHAKGK